MDEERVKREAEKIERDKDATEKQREEAREMKDSADESIGMREYWERLEKKIDDITGKFDDFKRDYVRRILTPEDARRYHEEDMRRKDFDGRDEGEKAKDIIEKIYEEEVL